MRTILAGFLHRGISVVCLLAGVLAGTAATAQGRFEPAIQVNDSIITRWELTERTEFLTLLRAPGDPAELAREQLIAAAIQNAAAEAAGVTLSPEELENGLSEFAARANLTTAEFITALEQNGVSAQTFRDFVSTGIRWGDYIRATFEDEARDVPRPVSERALTRVGTDGGVRVLFSEILLPANSPETRAASLERAAELRAIDTEEAFSAAARQFSIAGSRNAGGERNWVALDTLPDDVRPKVGALQPGQITPPIEVEPGILLYYLRDREVIPPGTPETLNIEYALFLTGSDEAAARRVLEEVDTCDDLYGIARDLPEDRLIVEAAPGPELPGDVGAAVRVMDVGDTAVLQRPSGAAALVLCSRTIDSKSLIDLEIVGTRVLNQKLSALAVHHLAELRAAAHIRDLTN